ncbi:MAG: glycosyltransferase [Minisyncoccia bacterium]|jgi:glycosyltransferase involved in cell wall biosynthesis
MTSVKILHINLVYLPAFRYGGPIRSVHNLNKWLVKRGADVTVYTTNIDGPVELDVPTGVPVSIDGVRVFYFPVHFFRHWFYSSDFRKALAMTAKDFDIIHITSVFTAASTLGAHYAKKRDIPYVISPKGSLMKTPLGSGSLKKKLYLSLIERKNLEEADAIHFTVPVEKEEYLRQGLSFKDSFVIPNGLDPDEFKEEIPPGFFRKKFGISADKKIVLFLGRLNWIKGLDTLLPSFKRVADRIPAAILVLAGGDDKKYKKTVEDMVEKHKLGDKVVFTGMIIDGDKQAALRDSDVFVMPSYSESFGMSALEAMYSRLPVVVTEGVSLAPVVEKYSAGLVVTKNEDKLSEAVINILSNPDSAKAMGERGRKIAESNFLMPVIAENFLAAYGRVIETHRGKN